MNGEDNTPELRARLISRATSDLARRRKHDFDNRLTELVFAVQLEDKRLIAFYIQELKDLYCEALTL